jgi:hypothetical protein
VERSVQTTVVPFRHYVRFALCSLLPSFSSPFVSFD